MAGYGIRSRNTERPYLLQERRSDSLNWRDMSGTAISHLEETMSYRTGSSIGKPISDRQADPNAYFMRMSVENRRKAALDHYGVPIVVPVDGEEFLPHNDNGHPFWNVQRRVATDRMRQDYNWEYTSPTRFGNYQMRGGPMYASEASIAPLHRPRMLFPMGTALRPGWVFGLSNPHGSLVNPNYYTQKAISNLAPNRPDFNLTSFLGELREGLPSILGLTMLKERTESLKGFGKGVSGEWVNHQFAVLPLISDIQGIFSTLSRVSNILLQNEKDAGSGVRRRMDFKTREEVVTFNSSDLENQGSVSCHPTYLFPVPTSPNGSSVWGATLTSSVTQSVVERISFAGSFTTYLPVGVSFQDKTERYMKLGQRLFGSGLTPATLWQLTPWSWLADWLFDIQSTLSAQELLADDSLVMNYGYLMRSSVHRATQQTTLVNAGAKAPFSSISSTAISHKKERLRANPYGFAATTTEGLNLKQWSILAALGITRM